MYIVSLFMIAVCEVADAAFWRATECRAVRCVAIDAMIMSGRATGSTLQWKPTFAALPPLTTPTPL